MKTIRKRLTYANVISTLCLFLLLGGGAAFAASQLAKNSVGTKQLKKNAVTPAKLSHSAKATLGGAAGARGPEGPQGTQGPQGPGAISFEVAVPENGKRNVVKTVDGLGIKANCGPSLIEFGLVTSEGVATMDVSGTANIEQSAPSVIPVDYTETNEFGYTANSAPRAVDIDVIARNTSVGSAFTRFDLHLASPLCKVRGVITPSSGG